MDTLKKSGSKWYALKESLKRIFNRSDSDRVRSGSNYNSSNSTFGSRDSLRDDSYRGDSTNLKI